MFRVGIVTGKGNVLSKNVPDRSQADDFLLETEEKEGLKYFRILDMDTNTIVETEKGVKKQCI